MDEFDLSDLTDREPDVPRPAPVAPPEPRRPRRAVLLVGVVVLLAVGALVVHLLTRPDPGADAFPVPPSPARDDGPRFDPFDGEDPLVASTIGGPGDSQVRLRFTPTTLDLALATFCHRTTRRPAPDDGWGSDTVLLVAGRPIGGGVCTDTPTAPGPVPVEDAEENRSFWSRVGVRVGRPVDVVLNYRAALGAGLDVPGRLGIGVYELTGRRIQVGSARLRTLLPVDAKDYRLRGYQMIPVGGRPVDLRTPVQGFGGTTVAVTVLRPDRTWNQAAAELTSDAGTDQLITSGQHVVPLQGYPRSLALTTRRGFRGEMILAWYSQAG